MTGLTPGAFGQLALLLVCLGGMTGHWGSDAGGCPFTQSTESATRGGDWTQVKPRDQTRRGYVWLRLTVVEPPNLMPPRSSCIPLDTKYSREDTKLHSSVEHTPRENSKIHIFLSGS